MCLICDLVKDQLEDLERFHGSMEDRSRLPLFSYELSIGICFIGQKKLKASDMVNILGAIATFIAKHLYLQVLVVMLLIHAYH